MLSKRCEFSLNIKESTFFGNLGMGDNLNRPMTGIRGAGYPGTAAAGGRGLFDPLNQATRGTGSPGFEAKKEETPEDKIKGLEKKVKTK